MRALPRPVKQQVQATLRRSADALGWSGMTVIEKAKQYGIWTEDPEIGGVLAGYIDPRNVRTYIKDTLMKPLARARMSDDVRIRRMFGLENAERLESFERPHGLIIAPNLVICWGLADDWKLHLMAVHERAYLRDAERFGVVLMPPLIRYHTGESRRVIEDAGRRLGIQHIRWLDPNRELLDLDDDERVVMEADDTEE
jgi:hypothetical protein